MVTVAERRVAARIAAALVALGVATALIVANHTLLQSGITPGSERSRGGIALRPRGSAPAPATRAAKDATERALTLLASDIPAGAVAVVSEAPPSSVAAVAPAPLPPVGRLESVAPGVAHTIQRAQDVAAPVTAPLESATPNPASPPDSGSDPDSTDCELPAPVAGVVGSVLS